MNRHSRKNPPGLITCLDEGAMKFLKENSRVKSFKRGDYIVRANESDANFYLINTGKVRVTIFSSEGKEISFVDIGEGGNFGEFSAIDGAPRSANVIALQPGSLTVVPPEVFVELLRRCPDLSSALIRQLIAMVRRLCDRIFEYSTLDVAHRIQLALLRESRNRIDLDGVARIRNPPTQAQMASRVSCTREAVSREYSRLEKQGIIERAPRLIRVVDYPRLKEMAGNLPL